ncbi:MAG: Uma2 family endonuclease, partial [Ardenticatenaceae bacterium]
MIADAKPFVLPDNTSRVEPVVMPRRDRPWTAQDLQALAGDENRYELIQGELLMESPASPVQGRYAMRLGAALHAQVEEADLGEVYVSEPGFELQSEPEQTIRAPDVAFVRKERIPPVAEQEGFWPLAPDLVVEIISPSETAQG